MPGIFAGSISAKCMSAACLSWLIWLLEREARDYYDPLLFYCNERNLYSWQFGNTNDSHVGLMTACEGLIYHLPFLRTLDIWLNILSSPTFHGNVFTHDKYMALGGYINRNNKYINGKKSFQPYVQKQGLRKRTFVRNVLWGREMLL